MIYKKREKNKKGVGALILSNTQRELRRNQKEDIISKYKSNSLLESPKKII